MTRGSAIGGCREDDTRRRGGTSERAGALGLVGPRTQARDRRQQRGGNKRADYVVARALWPHVAARRRARPVLGLKSSHT